MSKCKAKDKNASKTWAQLFDPDKNLTLNSTRPPDLGPFFVKFQMSYCLYVVLFRFVLFTNLEWVHLQLSALADRCEILAVSVARFGSNEKFGCDIAHFADCQKFGCGWSFTLHPAVFQPWKKLLRTLIHILRYNRSYLLIYTWVWRNINDNSLI